MTLKSGVIGGIALLLLLQSDSADRLLAQGQYQQALARLQQTPVNAV
jgi:hypothetical protein